VHRIGRLVLSALAVEDGKRETFSQSFRPFVVTASGRGEKQQRWAAFDQFSALATTYYVCLPALPALEEVMENFAELMQRLLEIQRGGEKSPELIAEDERLMEFLRSLAGKSAQTAKLGQDSP